MELNGVYIHVANNPDRRTYQKMKEKPQLNRAGKQEKTESRQNVKIRVNRTEHKLGRYQDLSGQAQYFLERL